MIAIHLVIAHHLIDILHPLIIQKHRVVAIRYDTLTSHELVILRLHPEAQSLDSVFLINRRVTDVESRQDLFQMRWVLCRHVLDQPQKSIFLVVFFKGLTKHNGRSKHIQKKTVHEGDCQGIDIVFKRIVIVVF